MEAHLAALNPHPQYATTSELTTAVQSLSGSLGYQHTQTTLSNAWTINHNLKRKPSITVLHNNIATDGTTIHNSDDVAVVTFAVAIDGTAYCI